MFPHSTDLILLPKISPSKCRFVTNFVDKSLLNCLRYVVGSSSIIIKWDFNIYLSKHS